MTLQAKIPDLPRPAFVAPCGSTLRPAAIVAAVAGHKNREITSSVSPCALALVLCGAVTLLRSHSSACPCYHHSTLECLIVSHVSLCPADAPCRVCPLCSSCVSLPPSLQQSQDTKTGRSPRQCLPVLSLLYYVVRSRCFALTRPLVHATIIAHLNVSLCLMFLSALPMLPVVSVHSVPPVCPCRPLVPPCAPLPVLCLWFLLSALLCMYCCRYSCSDLLRVRV